MSLALPAFVANAFQTCVDWYTLWVLGVLGGDSLAVFGIGRTIVNWAGAVLWAMGTGAMVLIAQAVGGDDNERARAVVVQSLFFVLGLALILAVLGLIGAKRLVMLVASDASLLTQSAAFLRTYLLSMVTMVMIFLVLAILRGAGESKMAMRIQILTNGLQAVFLWVFAVGVGRFEGIGVNGIAMGVALARIVGVSIAVGVFLKGIGCLRIRSEDLFSYRPNPSILRELVLVSLPSGGESLSKSSARMAVMRIISMTASSSNALAAYTIGSQVESLYDMIGSSFSVAAATAVGQNMGAARPDAAVQECNRSARYGLVAAVLIGTGIVMIAPKFTSLFTDNPEVVRMGAMFLRTMGLVAPFYMLGVTYAGGLKGAADTKTPMLVSIFGFWLVQIPFALMATSLMGLGTTGIWVSESLNYLVQGTLIWLAFRKRRWANI